MSFAGFYYISFHQETGNISGMYFAENSEQYDSLFSTPLVPLMISLIPSNCFDRFCISFNAITVISFLLSMFHKCDFFSDFLYSFVTYLRAG